MAKLQCRSAGARNIYIIGQGTRDDQTSHTDSSFAAQLVPVAHVRRNGTEVTVRWPLEAAPRAAPASNANASHAGGSTSSWALSSSSWPKRKIGRTAPAAGGRGVAAGMPSLSR